MKGRIKIIDTELTENFDYLVSRKIVIYGTGEKGQRTNMILRGIAGCRIDSFIVSDDHIGQSSDPEIQTIKSYAEKSGFDDTLVIYAVSDNYYDEIIAFSEDAGLSYEAVTWMAFYITVFFNLKDSRICEKTRNQFYCRNRLEMSRSKLSVNYGQIRNLLNDDCVLVYQPKKVGSSSVYFALEEAGISASHIHALSSYYKMIPWYYKPYEEIFEIWKNKIMPFQNVKVITMVRDPIARSISDLFDYIQSDYMTDEEFRGDDLRSSVIRKLYDDIHFGKKGYMLDWFDNELYKTFGINVFEYDFDKKKGYTYITRGNIEILVMKVETMDRNTDVIKRFIADPRLDKAEFQRRNVGAKKPYRYLYNDIKKTIKIPKEIKEFYYNNNEALLHFYTEEEINDFNQKWIEE